MVNHDHYSPKVYGSTAALIARADIPYLQLYRDLVDQGTHCHLIKTIIALPTDY